MGRNYELLTEFESDLEPAESCHANAVADATSRAVVPPAWAGHDSGDEEMQHLVRRVFLSTGENSPRAVVFVGVELAPTRTTLPLAEGLKQVLFQLRSVFDYVLIDVPCTSVCGHAQILGFVADAAILVVEANSTRCLSAKNAQQTLAAAGIRLLGTVLQNRSFPIPGRIYKRL